MKSESPIYTSTSIFSHVAGLLATVSEYVAARLRLTGIEAKEAGAQYGIGICMIAAGVFVALLGYVFLVLTTVFAIAAAFSGEHAWIGVMGGAAVLHIAGAAALGLSAKSRFKASAFSQTIKEFRKDQAWLHQIGNNR